MAIDVTNIVADLGLLTDTELERVQLAVNGEVAVRIQNERASRRMETAIVEAQSVGFTDADIDQAFEDARTRARRGKHDSAADVPRYQEPKILGEQFNNRPTKPTN